MLKYRSSFLGSNVPKSEGILMVKLDLLAHCSLCERSFETTAGHGFLPTGMGLEKFINETTPEGSRHKNVRRCSHEIARVETDEDNFILMILTVCPSPISSLKANIVHDQPQFSH